MKRTLFVSNLRSEDYRFLCRTPRMREAPEAVGRAKPSVPANFNSKLSTTPRAFAHLNNSSRHCEEDDTLPCVDAPRRRSRYWTNVGLFCVWQKAPAETLPWARVLEWATGLGSPRRRIQFRVHRFRSSASLGEGNATRP